MKILIISNTYFGYKNMTNHQFEYFYKSVIPYIKKNLNKDDILIHGGNVFSNKINLKLLHRTITLFEDLSKLINVFLLNNIQDEVPSLILKRIKGVNIIDEVLKINDITIIPNKSNILDISSKIIIHNQNNLDNSILKKFKHIISTGGNKFNEKNVINILSPYELKLSQKEKRGFFILNNNHLKLIENDFSPKFILKEITDIQELDNIVIDKNFVSIEIDDQLLNNKENLNKFNIFVNNNNIKNIKYKKSDKMVDKEITTNYDFSNIREVLQSHIKEKNINIEKELENIFNIYDKEMN